MGPGKRPGCAREDSPGVHTTLLARTHRTFDRTTGPSQRKLVYRKAGLGESEQAGATQIHMRAKLLLKKGDTVTTVNAVCISMKNNAFNAMVSGWRDVHAVY